MGEVYRVRDTKLGRDVALKILPAAFAADPDRLARFRREAQVLASLNHSNIATIHGFEESNGTQALVLELVEGPTLADRIAQGPTPLDDALSIAKQIAEALEAAHEQGIVHRDLKPANIKLRPDGTVKVLDFGLAKALSGEMSGSDHQILTNSPTITSPIGVTGVGVLLGTAAYMSPEQARGASADRRSDIWAFGVILHEMLAGKSLFQGTTISDTLAAVLKTEPDWSALPKEVPAPVQRLLRRCLEKDKRRRLDSAAAARLELEDVLTRSEEKSSAERLNATQKLRRRNVVVASAAAVSVAAALMAISWWPPTNRGPSPEPVRLQVRLGADASLIVPRGGLRRGAGSSLALSPDGRSLAFAAQVGTAPPKLYVRDLGQLEAVALPGTDDAGAPFFSPDGQWIAFFAQGRLKKVPIGGGAVVTISDVPAARGGTWGDDGTIVYTPHMEPGAGLMRVSAAGGTPAVLTTTQEGESTHRWAQLLPRAAAVLYTSSRSNTGPYDQANIVVQPLPSGSPSIVVQGGTYARYVPTGHLVYVRGGTLFAAPFDLDQLKLTGEATPVVEGVSYAVDSGVPHFAISTSGTLAYLPASKPTGLTQLGWADREGTITNVRDVPVWTGFALSPDGQRVAVNSGDTGLSDIWIYELNRDTLTRFTLGADDDFDPVWSPDGQFIAFTSNRMGGIRNVFVQRADGSGPAQILSSSRQAQMISSAWHPDAHLLAISSGSEGAMSLLPIKQSPGGTWEGETPTPLTRGSSPRFSPDGKWIAYHSDESGRREVYVQPFPSLAGKWQVSTNGGERPRFSSSERAVLYVQPSDLTIMRVPFEVQGSVLRPARPHPWANVTVDSVGSWDLHPDGKRVLMRLGAQNAAVNDHINLVFNALPGMP
jgi:serine/threonine-protein kinase